MEPDYQPTESSTIYTMNAKCFSVQISPYKIAIISTLSKLGSLLIVFILSSIYSVQGWTKCPSLTLELVG